MNCHFKHFRFRGSLNKLMLKRLVCLTSLKGLFGKISYKNLTKNNMFAFFGLKIMLKIEKFESFINFILFSNEKLFYFTHWLYVVFYILLIIHCSNFWKWFIVPFALMIFERIYNFYRIQSVNYGETYIKDVNLLSSNVTQLIVTRPPNFKFRSGDYIFIKIPTIARFEWHPFTISSAPELKGKLFCNTSKKIF
jgi:hypothetical protein